MEIKESPLFNKELIVVVDHKSPDQPIMANVQAVKEHVQEGEVGEKASVMSLDGRSFDFSTLLRIGLGKFTSWNNRFNFYRVLSLNPKDPTDNKIIIKILRSSKDQILNGNGQDRTSQSQNGQPKLK